MCLSCRRSAWLLSFGQRTDFYGQWSIRSLGPPLCFCCSSRRQKYISRMGKKEDYISSPDLSLCTHTHTPRCIFKALTGSRRLKILVNLRWLCSVCGPMDERGKRSWDEMKCLCGCRGFDMHVLDRSVMHWYNNNIIIIRNNYQYIVQYNTIQHFSYGLWCTFHQSSIQMSAFYRHRAGYIA